MREYLSPCDVPMYRDNTEEEMRYCDYCDRVKPITDFPRFTIKVGSCCKRCDPWEEDD